MNPKHLSNIASVVGLCFAVGNASIAHAAVTTLSKADEIAKHAHEFEKDLRDFGVKGKLDCSLMIELNEAPRDPSYGAVCKLSNGKESRPIMVCDDTMIGKFAVKFSGFAESVEWLTIFTKANCSNGG